MHALKKIGMKSAIWCYACLRLQWIFFYLGGKLKFSLDFNSTLLSINGGGILWKHYIFLIADLNYHLFTEMQKWPGDSNKKKKRL